MQFTNNNVVELVVPGGVPFAPGNDVIGIGIQLPPELAAYSPIAGGDPVQAAIVFYSSAYNPNATVPQVKFYWIGIGSDPSGNASSLCLGSGIVANASVSQVAVVNSGFAVVPSVQFAEMTMAYIGVNHNDNTIVFLGEDDAAGDGTIFAVTNGGLNPGATAGIASRLIGATGH